MSDGFRRRVPAMLSHAIVTHGWAQTCLEAVHALVLPVVACACHAPLVSVIATHSIDTQLPREFPVFE